MSPMLNRPAINARKRAEAEHKKSMAGETPLVLPDMPDLGGSEMKKETKPAKPAPKPSKKAPAKPAKKAAKK